MIGLISLTEVNDSDSLARYIQQRVGVPYPTIKDLKIFRSKVRGFFEKYPNLEWATLCHVADWAKARKKRFAHVWQVIDAFKYAYADGYLNVDLTVRTDETVEERISCALREETDPVWRARLMASQGMDLRKEVVSAWETQRSSPSKLMDAR